MADLQRTIKPIVPQEGFQRNFLSSGADVVVAGSGAGVGKTFAGLLEAARHITNPKFGAVFFRRTYSEITNEGGLWDESREIYPYLGGVQKEAKMLWQFPSGATVSFSHLQYDKDVYSWQGAQIPLIIFDELTHFTESQFWYLLSRNRSTCGVRPYLRAMCNPDPDSFVAKMIEWYIDEVGFPMPERSGVVRYFMRDQGELVWGDTKEDVADQVPHLFNDLDESTDPLDLIKSFTFIPGSIYDNKKLLKKDPGYLANLMAQDEVTKARLLGGNWKIRNDATSLFNPVSVKDLFTNYPDARGSKGYITCDAARFGRDLCVIYVWDNWTVVHTVVIAKSDVHDIVDALERCRQKFHVPKSRTLVDQDGVGAGTVAKGGYVGFSGGAQARKVQGRKENYANLKTQCYYLLSEKVNSGAMAAQMNTETVEVDGVRSTKVKLGSAIYDVRDLLRDDLNSVRRTGDDIDGKKQINSKEEQKVVLRRSPDFGDTAMMRVYFDLIPQNLYA